MSPTSAPKSPYCFVFTIILHQLSKPFTSALLFPSVSNLPGVFPLSSSFTQLYSSKNQCSFRNQQPLPLKMKKQIDFFSLIAFGLDFSAIISFWRSVSAAWSRFRPRFFHSQPNMPSSQCRFNSTCRTSLVRLVRAAAFVSPKRKTQLKTAYSDLEPSLWARSWKTRNNGGK